MSRLIEPDEGTALQSFARAGRDILGQLEQAISAQLEKEKQTSPFSQLADLLRAHLELVVRLWETVVLASFGLAQRSTTERNEDRRFRDTTWSENPYFELLKQSYLAGVRSLYDLVEEAARLMSGRKCSFDFARAFMQTRLFRAISLLRIQRSLGLPSVPAAKAS